MQLSKHFSLSELTSSQTATRNNIDNTPTPIILDNLKFLAENLENVRELLNCPIIISSGYRSPVLNAKIGGSKSSQHVLGHAADFTSPKFGSPENVVRKIKDSSIQYDQLILEFNSWVHISFSKLASRRQTLVIDRAGTKTFV
jgi:uncharacterized protein YcbK (DUF882 family)